MSRDTLTAKSRIVIEKYRGGELVERMEIKNEMTSHGANRIAYLVYGHDSAVWGVESATKALALGDANFNTIKVLVPGDMTITEDTAAMKWIVEVTWTDDSTDEYTVHYAALQGEGEYSTVGGSIFVGAHHYATPPSPITKTSTDIIKYKWVVEIPYVVG